MAQSRLTRSLSYQIDKSYPSDIHIKLCDTNWDYEKLEISDHVNSSINNITIDLSNVKQVTTAALAQLILFKRNLARIGHKMIVRGINTQPRAMCEILKLNNILVGK